MAPSDRPTRQLSTVHRVLLALAATLLVADLAALVSLAGDARAEPAPVVAAAAPLAPPAPTTTTTSTFPPTTTTAPPLPAPVPPTTTTTTTPPPAPQPIVLRSPQSPPADSRAVEPAVVLGTFEVPKLGLSVPLNQGISLTTIDRGPSHWPGTAMPGEYGNVVVAGHRVTRTRPFRYIDTLVVGDEIIFTVNGVRSVYRVTGTDIVTPDAMHIVQQTAEPMVTLFACHPPGSARYRYVVRAALVGAPVAPPSATTT